MIVAIRETGMDVADNIRGKDDPVLRGEKDPKQGYHIDIPNRPVGPSSTQVRLSMLTVVLNDLSVLRTVRLTGYCQI